MHVHIDVIGQGEALVLLHGFGFDNRIFSSLISILQKDYCLYAVDLPGFGKTPFCDKEVFLTSLVARLPSRFTLLGWSLGGLYATYIAALFPHRVKQLLNIGSTPYFLKSSSWPGISPTAWARFTDNMLNNKDQALKDFVMLQLGSVALMPDTYIATDQGLKMGLSLLSTWDLRDILSTIHLPVTYLWGRLDSIVPYRIMSVMQARYPMFQYALFEKSAHMPFLSEQSRFIEWFYRLDKAATVRVTR